MSSYEATLASKASQQQEEVADWERWDEDGFGAVALPRMAWQERSAGGGAAGGGGASGALLEVLVRTRGGGGTWAGAGRKTQRQGRRGAMFELLTGQVGRCLEFPYQIEVGALTATNQVTTNLATTLPSAFCRWMIWC